MTTLHAHPDARRALDRKKLESRLIAVQGRAEALPQLNLGGMIRSAQNRMNLLQFDACATILDDVDDRIARHMAALEESEMAAAGQAQDQLLAGRGIETVAEGVAKTRDGWRWLTSRNPRRLSADQVSTGNRYCALYLAANRDTLSTVSANDNVLAPEPRNAVDELAKARANLARIQRHITDATGSDRLVGLLDAVCGRGETLRTLAGGDDRKAGAYEVELRLALDMAGVAFKGGKREEAA